MLNLFFVFNSFKNIYSKNMLQYFSTTNDVNLRNQKLVDLMNSKSFVKSKFTKNSRKKTLNISVNKHRSDYNQYIRDLVNTCFNTKQPKNSLSSNNTIVMVNANGVLVKKSVPLLFNWYNKQRSLKGNWFRYYYYDRLPFMFLYYPFSYRKWLLRYLIVPLRLKYDKRLWRKRFSHYNYFLVYMKNEFFYINRALRFIDGRLIGLPLNNPFVLLRLRVQKTKDAIYTKYKKHVNKFTRWYESITNAKKQELIDFGVNTKHPLFKLKTNYMLHIKFYKTKYMYFNFRFYKVRYRYMKGSKWMYKKAYRKSFKKKTFSLLGTSFRVKNRLPFSIRRYVRSCNYKRFSYYWLRYFFKRFKHNYIDANKNHINYKDIKKYLLCWLWKVRTYKFLSLHSVNPARGFLYYKSNKLHNEMKGFFSLFYFKRYYVLTFAHDRNELDSMYKQIVNKNRYLYRNFYWRFYKSTLERRKAQILKRHCQFTWGLRPYIFVHKKQKVFYNWADRHIFKRYPLYRYKYTLFFKFPRYADYRRLFKNQLREQHVFRYLYRLKLSQLIKAFRKATYKTKRIFELMFLKYFELRLDTVVYRLNFAWSLKHARQLVLRGLFLVNNKVIDNHKYHVALGDVIMPIKRLRMQPLSKKYLNYVDYGLSFSWTRLFYRPIQSDQYPVHFLLNERIPAGMIVNKFNPNTLRFNKPYSVQFLTLSLLKYS
jgi:hypothetical protein